MFEIKFAPVFAGSGSIVTIMCGQNMLVEFVISGPVQPAEFNKPVQEYTYVIMQREFTLLLRKVTFRGAENPSWLIGPVQLANVLRSIRIFGCEVDVCHPLMEPLLHSDKTFSETLHFIQSELKFSHTYFNTDNKTLFD